MLALLLIPMAPRVARAEGPIIDADVQRLMDEKPDEEHALIVSVELCRTPLNLEELLPTPEETNECTRLWRAWEMLAEEFEEGCNEQLTQEQVDAAYAEAKAYDEVIVSIQKAAYRAYHEDYAEIVSESVPDVVESLRSVLGDKVRRVSETSKLLAIRADRATFETIRETASIKRVSFDMMIGPMLDKSRKGILADKVHCPASSIPYTGDGVKVAIVDDGVVYDHPRLPAATSADERDFTTDDPDCEFAGDSCTFGHGSFVAGVVFCIPDANPCGTSGDGFVGIAYEASLVNAKVSRGNGGLCHVLNGFCPPQGCQEVYFDETWSSGLDAFEWAVDSTSGPLADVINFSRGAVVYGIPDEDSDTLGSSAPSLNVDWLVYASGASFVHSCGNIDRIHNPPIVEEVSPPSGAYNCISVGAYDDYNGDADDRETAVIWEDTAPGPTDDGRRKPDLCAPGVEIMSARWRYLCESNCTGCTNYGFVYDFADVTGTSFAAPHVTGVIALLKEASPSLTPRQIHAILVNATDYALLPDQETRQTGWDEQGG